MQRLAFNDVPIKARIENDSAAAKSFLIKRAICERYLDELHLTAFDVRSGRYGDVLLLEELRDEVFVFDKKMLRNAQENFIDECLAGSAIALWVNVQIADYPFLVFGPAPHRE